MIVEFKRLFKKKPTTLLELFKYIKSTGIASNEKTFGICHFIYSKYDIKDKKDLRDLFRKWPCFSGNNVFPIPSALNFTLINISREDSAEDCYIECFNKWDKSTNYGKARWNFVEWAIDELEGKHV